MKYTVTVNIPRFPLPHARMSLGLQTLHGQIPTIVTAYLMYARQPAAGVDQEGLILPMIIPLLLRTSRCPEPVNVAGGWLSSVHYLKRGARRLLAFAPPPTVHPIRFTFPSHMPPYPPSYPTLPTRHRTSTLLTSGQRSRRSPPPNPKLVGVGVIARDGSF
jgi:hypothetical protein